MRTNTYDLDLQHFAFFERLIKVGNVSVAAKMLDMSQPAASRCLGRLRRAFNDELFVRASTGMVPTARALQISDNIHELMEVASRLESDSRGFDPSKESREFTVACPDIGQWAVIHSFTPIMSSYPRIQLRTVTVPDIDLPHSMEAGGVDLVYGPYPLLRGSMKRQIVHSGEYFSICRADHPFVSSPTLETFIESDHLIYQNDTCVKLQKDVFDALTGIVPTDRFRVYSGSYMAALLSVIHTNLIITSPALVLRPEIERLGLAIVPPPIPLPKFEIHQYWHPRMHRDAGHSWFRSMMRSALLASEPRLGDAQSHGPKASNGASHDLAMPSHTSAFP